MDNAAVQQGKRATYPAYKPSGVEWLGDVPEHWEVNRAKAILARNDGGVWGEDFDDDGVIVLRSTEQTVGGEWNIVDPAKRRLTATEYAACRLREGDLVVTKSSGSSLHIGKTSIVTTEVESLNCCYSNFMQRLRVDPNAVPQFMWYVLNGELGRKQFDYFSSTTTGLANLNGEIIGNVTLSLPPLSEQRAIAVFLDRETARMDALIEKKRRQVELLQEKRSALISHAVTKGLDPNAPLKDSGIEWLGEVPEHWHTWKVTHGFQRLGSGTTPKSDNMDYYGGDIPWVTTSELRENVIEDTANEVTDAALRDYPGLRLYPAGTLLFAMYGATIGRMGILGVPATVNQACAAFVGPKHLTTKFTYYWLWMRRPTLIALSAGGGQPNLSQDDLREVRIPAPSIDEQLKIVQYIETELGGLDPLVQRISKSIDVLMEYRTALISAAVTGKIDVRGEVA